MVNMGYHHVRGVLELFVLSLFEKLTQASSGMSLCLGSPDEPNPYVTAKSKFLIGQSLSWSNMHSLVVRFVRHVPKQS